MVTLRHTTFAASLNVVRSFVSALFNFLLDFLLSWSTSLVFVSSNGSAFLGCW